MVILGGHYAEETKGDKSLSSGDYTKMVLFYKSGKREV